eukprot:CAMPEP_0174830176 /NCGR_PEP_ID=MMETSP1114-20130205/2377_1 /TAXON_ID=312471 /ORGANISM="Neobodo designis, Strain CCAP 1951/1" /LENGTH=495 /DNA_ID=CAMNT_0016063963 /DNA_START=57 /DNA_END=1542 /DNA_ORIENTATION=+
MKVKKKDLRKRLPQLPINYPGPDTIPFDYEEEKSKVENLCKRLADSEASVRDAVLAELPRFIKEACAPFVDGGALDAAEAEAAKDVDLSSHDAGRELWAALLRSESVANLSLIFEKLCLGLFYCMWHSDKPLVQHECALKIVQLMQAPQTPLLKELLLRAMLRTLAKHWNTIDRYRLDKYMAMARKLVFQTLAYLVEHVQRPLAAVSAAPASVPTAAEAAAAASSPAGKKKKARKSGGDAVTTTAAETPAAAAAQASPQEQMEACARSPALLRIGATFQWDVVRGEGTVGLTMHIADLMLTEMIRTETMEAPLFVAVSLAIPLYAMQRGDYVEKRVMDNFIVPIAAGQLERRSDEFSLVASTMLAQQLDQLSVSRGTHYTVRPLMVEAQRLVDNYVGVKAHPEEYEPVSHRDERARIAAEVRAAEDVKMGMSRLAMKHAAAMGAVRAVRRSTKVNPAKSKRNPRWKKNDQRGTLTHTITSFKKQPLRKPHGLRAS